MKYILYFHGFLYFHSCEIQLLVSPAKQERHIGIRIPACRRPQRNPRGGPTFSRGGGGHLFQGLGGLVAYSL